MDSQLKQKERLFCLYMAQAFTPGEFDLMVGYADHFSSKARFTLVD